MARASAALTGSRRSAASQFVLPERAARLVRESGWLGITAFAAFLLMILLTFDKGDPGWSHAIAVQNLQNPTGRAEPGALDA